MQTRQQWFIWLETAAATKAIGGEALKNTNITDVKNNNSEWLAQITQDNYQFLDGLGKFFLGCFNSLLLANDNDEFLVLVIVGWEHDTGTSVLPHLADVGSSPANQEPVVFRFCSYLSSKAA